MNYNYSLKTFQSKSDSEFLLREVSGEQILNLGGGGSLKNGNDRGRGIKFKIYT